MGKKSNKTVARTVYGNTTTTNPYVTATTNNKGTASAFNKGTALDTINNFVNKNMSSLLNSYLKPTLNTVTNKAKMQSFMNTLNSNSLLNLENDIINPLSKRNMIRSSQATDMYNNLAQNNTSQISNYAQELLANSQKDAASMLTNLMLLYMNGYNVLNDTQRMSLNSSQGNSTKTQNSSVSSGIDTSQMMQLVTQLAMMMAG